MIEPLIDAVTRGLAEENPDARRLFHGRGHCYSGLEHINVDLLGPVLMVILYRETEPGWVKALAAVAGDSARVEVVLVQHRYRPGAPTEAVLGVKPATLIVEEQGLRYELNFEAQNTGLFLDMANGRRWVREQARDRRVLNLFAYTCAFSVAALAGGAETVVNLDMSKGALSRGRDNHRLNGQDLSRVRFLGHDLFRSWGKLKKLGPYSLLIIDPPSFQRGSFVATKDYQRVLRRLPELLAEEAEVLVCLNDPTIGSDFLRGAMAEQCPRAAFVERLANPEVFVEENPERGLKVLRFRYWASSQ